MENLNDTTRYTKERAEKEAETLQWLIKTGFAEDYEQANRLWMDDTRDCSADPRKSQWHFGESDDDFNSLPHRPTSEDLALGKIELETCLAEYDHHCFACHKPLKLVFERSINSLGCTQYLGALAIRVNGGFGMYVDPAAFCEDREKHWYKNDKDKRQKGIYNPYEIFVCKDCADKLCTTIPWLGTWLQHDCPNEVSGECGDCIDCCKGCRRNPKQWCYERCDYSEEKDNYHPNDCIVISSH